MESTQTPSSENFYRDLAMLDWQSELGVDEAICETPINRYDLPDVLTKPTAAVTQKQPQGPAVVADSEPESGAQACETLAALQKAVEEFEGCAQKQGAKNTLFSMGNPAARVMIICDAPTREEDRAGQLFAGQTGVLLGRMMGAIGLTLDAADPALSYYVASVFPWRAPQNQDPAKKDLTLMRPFILRHIALTNPDVVLLMGKSASKTLLETENSLARLRGPWQDINGTPALPIFHPEYLLRNPAQKRAAWVDLLSTKARLDGAST